MHLNFSLGKFLYNWNNLDIQVMIGINGLGRMGRLAIRAMHQLPSNLKIQAVNDPNFDPKSLKYFLQHDSAHQRFAHKVELWEHGVLVNGHKIRLYSNPNPASIPWGDDEVNIVLQATGKFLTRQTASKHLLGGAKKVIISANPKDQTLPLVFGVNHSSYQKHMDVISSSSCTTITLTPLAKVLEETFGIQEGFMTTIHCSTGSQNIVDGPFKKGGFRAGRSALNNIIPHWTGADTALQLIMPELAGKVRCVSFRVPTINVSVIDFTFSTKKDCTYEEISEAMKKASEGSLKGILGYTQQQIVSSDIMHDPRSTIFDKKAGISISNKMHKIISWYDNEWGYINRMLDLAQYIREADGL